MLLRSLLAATLLLGTADQLCGQTTQAQSSGGSNIVWHGVGERSGVSGAVNDSAVTPASGTTDESITGIGRRLARVSNGSGSLPNQHGQLWREYDITPYTLRVTSTSRPEQAVIDWILRETGYEAWHGEPLGILSASRRSLLVYHTPQMQELVADVVDRFVSSEAETHRFGLRVMTVDHPNWRAKVHRMLRPVQVQAPGVQAWLVSKEDATILLAQLKRRNDFREHSSPNLLVNNGQSTIVNATRSKSYVRNVLTKTNAWPGFEPETGVIDEGYSLEFNPLLSVDGSTIDAVIKCNIDQVEKMVPVVIDMPTASAPRQRTQIEIPQMVQFRFHERFRWPVGHILLVDMGMVAPPVPADGKPLLPMIPLPLPTSPARADLLVMVESKGNSQATTRSNRPGLSQANAGRDGLY